MNYKTSSEISEELLDRIISVAYGSASFFQKRKIEKLASEDEIIKKILDEYRNTANEVHSIKKEIYTEKSKVQNIAETEKTIFDEVYQILLGRPATTVIAAILLIVAFAFSLFLNKELTYQNYSLAEIERANLESKQALMIVSEIFSKTEKKLTNEILINEVSKPINEGINAVNKLFYKEKKNES
jgi:hypothetical protein